MIKLIIALLTVQSGNTIYFQFKIFKHQQKISYAVPKVFQMHKQLCFRV